MYWSMKRGVNNGESDAPATPEGRFVLHRHHDAVGPHLDLRLEQDGYLMGWRIDGTALTETLWASEKAPHPLRWLEHDGEAIREDEGVYAWRDRDEHGGALVLHGRNGIVQLTVRREDSLPPSCVRALCTALAETRIRPEEAAGMILDGVEARRRGMERFCGLGRELDGRAFDEAVWRKTLGGLSLREIHQHLEAYEVRFDQKYPPQPVSKPEPLSEEAEAARSERVMAILRG